MNILFLVPYPTDEAPSQRFRFEQYFGALESAGHSYKVYSFWTKSAWKVLYKSGRHLSKVGHLIFGFIKRWWQVLFLCHRYHIIFIHREVAPIGPPIYEWILAKIFRKKIIYDFDDAIWIPNTSSGNKIASKLKWHSKVRTICKWAWKVSCGNEFLRQFALKHNSQAILNPTTIDTEYHKPKPVSANSKVTIGWTGTHSTLKYLELLSPVLINLQTNNNYEFIIIANSEPSVEFNYTFIQWNKSSEIEDLSKFDIGVMPLTDDKWSNGKCGFKALQYMSLGIPTLASPVGVNTDIIDAEKNGYLCSSTEEWITTISKLINNHKLRNEIGEQGRKQVEKNYSIKSNRSNFISLFDIT